MTSSIKNSQIAKSRRGLNQHIAATGRKYADAGNTAELINHALDQGAIDPVSGTLDIGAFAGALGRNVGITFAPQDKPGGGYHSGGDTQDIILFRQRKCHAVLSGDTLT